MPGPVSDSYDPEFGTATNAEAVRFAVEGIRNAITILIGSPKLRNIVELANEDAGPDDAILDSSFTERDWRIIRFCLNRTLETL